MRGLLFVDTPCAFPPLEIPDFVAAYCAHPARVPHLQTHFERWVKWEIAKLSVDLHLLNYEEFAVSHVDALHTELEKYGFTEEETEAVIAHMLRKVRACLR